LVLNMLWKQSVKTFQAQPRDSAKSFISPCGSHSIPYVLRVQSPFCLNLNGGYSTYPLVI
jgi:hypothetical protein